MANFSNFTPRAQQVLTLAKREALRLHHAYIGTEHVLLGLFELGQGVAVNVLQRMGLDIVTVHEALQKHIVTSGGEMPVEGGGELVFTPRVKRALVLAAKEARTLGHPYVGTEHILLGLLQESDGIAAKILGTLSIDLEVCRKEILSELDPYYSSHEEEDDEEEEEEREEPVRKMPTISRQAALRVFGRDLTERARAGDLDPVIGREKEIRRVIQILCRRTKNNPVLVGEAGVGKTAIVEGLAQAIVQNRAPEPLLNKKIFTLDLALMLAGTKYRGQFEERLKAVMEEIVRAKNIVLFLDEMHTIVGAGSAEGAMDASNILKPALARGEVQCIGATTIKEYRKHIEKDSALERRFQSVMVDPPSVKDTIAILNGLKGRYEQHHRVIFSDSALEYAVKLSNRFIPDRHLPDKAIDILDEAGARVWLRVTGQSPATEEIDAQLSGLKEQKAKAIAQQSFEEAANIRDKERVLKEKRQEVIDHWKKRQREHPTQVDESNLLQVVSEWTGIPLSRMETKESQRLLALRQELKSAVVGQDEAIDFIVKALQRSKADLKDPTRPIGSFFFMGPTGVGKTHLAKSLAYSLFGSRDAIIQVDMSEYMEKHTVSRMIGAPPGYVGHDEGGQLTERVRQKPYSIVLFDEIEKAHPDVTHLLLQILEEGKLTDSLGRSVDFRNTVIIMTSNVGAEILYNGAELGFGTRGGATEFETLKERVRDAMKKTFKPEFLNRINEIVVFRPLSREALEKIVDIELNRLRDRLKERQIILEFNSNAKNFLMDKGYEEKSGARPLRRTVERYVEDMLAEAFLRQTITHAQKVSIHVARDKKGLSFRAKSLDKDKRELPTT